MPTTDQNPPGGIAGYDYGSPTLAPSPVDLPTLATLRRLTGFTDEDRALLADALPLMEQHADEILDLWRDALLREDMVAAANRTLGGQAYPEYTRAYRPRFRQWFLDVCAREQDQAWLDYQYEIGLRHHRTKKNATDAVTSTPHIPLRYLLGFVAVAVNSVRPYFERAFPADRAVRIHEAWVKAVVLSVTLWSLPYAAPDDW